VKGREKETHPESEFHSGGVKNRHGGFASQGRTRETSTVVPCLREGANGSEDDGDVRGGEFGGEEVSFSAAMTMLKASRGSVGKARGRGETKTHIIHRPSRPVDASTCFLRLIKVAMMSALSV
jgi:hypothetical protein